MKHKVSFIKLLQILQSEKCYVDAQIRVFLKHLEKGEKKSSKQTNMLHLPTKMETVKPEIKLLWNPFG